MSTAPSWTEPSLGPHQRAREALRDLRILLRFRLDARDPRSRRHGVAGALLVLALTALAAVVPGLLNLPDDQRAAAQLLLPSACLGVLLIAIISAAATGGGRELVPRDQAVAFPISPTVDHLGALLMAPFNIAFFLQVWVLLGAASLAYDVTPRLVLAVLGYLLWIATSLALAQIVAWSLEWVRRGPHGVVALRSVTILAGLGLGWATLSGALVRFLDTFVPLRRLEQGMAAGALGSLTTYVVTVGVVVLLGLCAVVVGARLANAVARRLPRDEIQLETAHFPARSHPRSDLIAMIRIDRSGVWRSVPLRRGVLVLGVLPGAIALLGSISWQSLPILPGLVAAGGALLFGVNAWCLDARGALWRDNLPASPSLALASRAVVLAEVIAVPVLLTVLLGVLRAGTPSWGEVSGLICVSLVVIAQVVTTSLGWSIRHPYAVDLRSARATPAPPARMVLYSSRLALSTTMTGMVFMVAARAGWEWPVLLAFTWLLWTAYRLATRVRRWNDPQVRSRVIATVAA